MSALEGTSAVIVGDTTAAHYAAWLLTGLGASVTVAVRGGRESLSPVAAWLTAGATLRTVAEPDLVALSQGVDALIADAGGQLSDGHEARLRTVHEARPQLVLVSVSPYGLSGPMAKRRATHQELQALGGLINETGPADLPPIPVYGDVPRMATGANAALAALLGLWRRRRTGQGAFVDISMLETVVGLQSSRIYAYAYTGLVFRRALVDSVGNYLPCKDGYVHIYPPTTAFDELLRFLEIDEAAVPQEVWDLDDKMRQFSHPAVLDLATRAMSTLTMAELVERGVLWRIPVSPALMPELLLQDPHLAARGFLEEVDVGGREVRAPAYPFRGDIWRHAEPGASPPAHQAEGRQPSVLPLAGVRVTEFGTAWSGPMAAEILAMFGAEVIKVEAANHLDTARSMQTLDMKDREPVFEWTYNYHPVNGGKLHFGLDLDGPRGAEVGRRLIEASDVFVSNISMRALRNLGMDGPAIQAVNPRCTVVHSTSGGLDGPYARLAGYGSGMELMTGVAGATGRAAGLERMVRSQLLHPDVFGALHQALAAVAGLFRRERTGRGTVVDLSQFECGAVAATGPMLASQGAAAPSEPIALRLPCAGDDHWLAVSVASGGEWATLLDVLGLPAAEEAPAPVACSGAGWERAAEASRCWEKVALAEALQVHGIAAEPVNRPDEALLNPQLVARNYFMRPANATFGTRYTIGRWQHFADTDVAPLDGVHFFGQDNARVLMQSLGYSPAEAAAIQADGTVTLGPYPGPRSPFTTSIEAMEALGWIYRRDEDFCARLGIARFDG